MKVMASTFESMFYFTPGIALVSMEVTDRESGERVRLGWSVTVAWLLWEVTVEIYNQRGRAMR